TSSKRDWSSDVCSSDLISSYNYFVVLGSKASFKPSPTKLIERIVSVIHTAGGTQIHGLFCKTSVCLASINILPQLGISTGTPIRSEERRVGKERNSWRS